MVPTVNNKRLPKYGSKLSASYALAFALTAYSAGGLAQLADDPTSDLTNNLSRNVYSINANGDFVDEDGYRIPSADESEFDNYSDSFVRDWRIAEPEYEDTSFGEFMYNEASTPTKLEMLRLISKDTPSTAVLLHAVAMGVDIESILQASIKYEPGKAGDLSASAVSVLPVLSDAKEYRYGGYELEDLERDEDETKPYRVSEVIEKFFDQRQVLRPYPDWFEGQYHFLASAAELKSLQGLQKDSQWYKTKSTRDVQKRPIFVSLYEATESVLIDGQDRIEEALADDPNAVLPVVFVFNRLRERSIDQLNYPKTLRGIQQAYTEKSLMLTPVPEWQLGEYHMYADVSEFYEIFDMQEEEDFEPENWQKLLEEAEDYSVTNTSFLIVVLPNNGERDRENKDDDLNVRFDKVSNLLYAAWDNPRTEAEFPYVAPNGGQAATLDNIMGKGLIFNRPDLLAALNALGVQKVPVSYYYVDSARVKPYVKGGRALLNSVQGVITKPTTPGGTGGFSICASPPCVAQ